MISTRSIGKAIRAFFERELNARIQTMSTDIGESISPVSKIIGSMDDPYSLSQYNTLMIAASTGKIDRRDLDAPLSYDLVLAVSSGSMERVSADCEGTLDSILNLVSENYRLGGAVLNSNIPEFEVFPPTQGNSPVGVVYIKLAVSVDAR